MGALPVTVMLFWILCKVSGDTILRQWSESEGSFDYIYLYILLSLGGNIFVFLRCFTLMNVISIKSCQIIHSEIIDKLLRAPVNLFFNVTPTGRIINRLTNDINVVDEGVAVKIGSFLSRTFNLFAVIVMQLLFLPWLILLLPIILWLAAKCGRLYLSSTRELARFLSLSKSKLIHQFAECISGSKLIRCFQKQEYFLNRFHQELTQNAEIIFNANGTKCWVMLYAGFISSLFMCGIMTAIIAVSYTHLTLPTNREV